MAHPSLKKLRTESHAGGASDSVANVDETAEKAVNDKGAAKGGIDPAVEARKKVAAGDTQLEAVARATGSAPTQSSVAEVIDGDGKVANSATTTSFPMASIGSLTLICQLDGMIQVCASSSSRGLSCYVMAS
jgi:hypothetical protein